MLLHMYNIFRCVVYDASWLFLGFLALPTYIGIEEYNCMRNIKKGL
jgi:hypothetical protein